MDPSPPAGEDTRQRILNQNQFQARARLRQQKLKLTLIGYNIVLVFLAGVQFIGIGFFTLGFLLQREVLPGIATDVPVAPAFTKAVVLVIDALRFDFCVPNTDSVPYHNNFPILYDMAKHENALLLKFIADPPTTTLQRLKGLSTGLLPTFIDAGSNFDGDAIDEDNWLLQLHRNNKTVAFMGDDTWDALFHQYIDPRLNFPYDSLNVWDLHTVDNGVIEHLFPLLDNGSQWDVLIGHFLGVDHVGHRYGPNHFSMKEKLNQMNDVIEKVVSQLDSDTLLVVMGDHGMDSTGNHGGDSPDEVEATLFMYSKSAKFRKLDGDAYNITDGGKYHRLVNQIDLVPTISLLLGLPIPHNNLGFPIYEAFSDDNHWNDATHAAATQLKRFHHLAGLLADSIQEITPHSAERFQHRVLEECHKMWAEFDLTTMLVGIGILFLALTFILTYARLIPLVRVSTMLFEFIGLVIAMLLLGVVLSFSIYIVLKPADFTLKKCISAGALVGTIIGFWAPVMDRFSIQWLWHLVKDFFVYNFNVWSFMGLLTVVLHTLIFALNSFVVWEDQMINFFVVTFGFMLLFACATLNKLKTPADRILGLSHAVTFTVLSRVVATIGICREEQRPYCTPLFTTLWWLLVLLFVVSWLLPMVIMHFYKLLDLYHLAAPLWIGSGLKIALMVTTGYWLVEWLQAQEQVVAYLPQINGYVVKSIKLAVARLVLFGSLFMANLSWSKGPLCVKLASDGGSQSILGYSNVYGLSYFLLVLNFFVSIMMVLKPLAAVLLSMLVVQILLLLELFDMLSIRRNLVAPIVFTLLGYQHFFLTGHQATIPSIQWEVGFITTETIWFPFTHLNIVLNTFGLFIIVALAIPLITLWKIPPSNKPITVLSQIITNATTMVTYQMVVSLSLLIFAAHFRRHLMVWKVFAPRFMLSGMLVIVLNVVLVLVTLWFGTGKVVTQVNRIFGK